MQSRTRRWVFASALTCGLALPFVFAAVIQLLPNPDVSARQWYSNLSVAGVGAAESSIQSLSYSRQQAVFNHMTPAKQSRFWQERFVDFVKDHPNLTADQHAAVSHAQELLSADFFAHRATYSANNSALLAEIYRVFTREDADALTARVAPKGTFEHVVAASSEWIKAQVTVLAGPNDHCDCIEESPIGCGSSLQCVSPPPDGCRALDDCWAGWLTWYTCYGLCGVPL